MIDAESIKEAAMVVCTNGMIVSRGAFPAYCVSHRGNVVDEVVAAALNIAERFESLAGQVERMEHRQLFKDEQHDFALQGMACSASMPITSSISLLAFSGSACGRSILLSTGTTSTPSSSAV